jgi:hypothetical protein
MVATFCVQFLTEISHLLAGQFSYVSIDSVSGTCPIMYVTNWLPCYIQYSQVVVVEESSHLKGCDTLGNNSYTFVFKVLLINYV